MTHAFHNSITITDHRSPIVDADGIDIIESQPLHQYNIINNSPLQWTTRQSFDATTAAPPTPQCPQPLSTRPPAPVVLRRPQLPTILTIMAVVITATARRLQEWQAIIDSRNTPTAPSTNATTANYYSATPPPPPHTKKLAPIPIIGRAAPSVTYYDSVQRNSD